MQVKIAVSGVDNIKAKKTGNVVPYAFGMEAAPATLGQVLKFWTNGLAVRPGDVVTINVNEIAESYKSVWVRGHVVGK